MDASRWLFAGLFVLLLAGPGADAQSDPNQVVRQAVDTELHAAQVDHSHWLYFDTDAKPDGETRQWVAETGHGSLHRVLRQKGKPVTADQQSRAMDRFVHDTAEQEKQRKSSAHDDQQAAEMLRLLPAGFVWTKTGERDGLILLHFTPNPGFKPPSWSARVFAAMEGDMKVSADQHRIVSLSGRLVRDVKFCGGLCGSLSSGGTFAIERQELEPKLWQIVAMHIHIRGSALFFKNISQVEDETKSHFKRLPDGVTLAEAQKDLMSMQESPTTASGTR